MKKASWKKHTYNEVLKGEGFAISYNPNTQAVPGMAEIQKLGELLSGGQLPAKTPEETALIKDDQFLILNGDFRKEYEELLPKGYEACKEFYESRQTLQSKWSN